MNVRFRILKTSKCEKEASSMELPLGPHGSCMLNTSQASNLGDLTPRERENNFKCRAGAEWLVRETHVSLLLHCQLLLLLFISSASQTGTFSHSFLSFIKRGEESDS